MDMSEEHRSYAEGVPMAKSDNLSIKITSEFVE